MTRGIYNADDFHALVYGWPALAALTHAREHLVGLAQDLRACNTVRGRWPTGDYVGRVCLKEYRALMRTAAALGRLRRHIVRQSLLP